MIRIPFIRVTVRLFSSNMSKKSALVLLSDGSEEMETVITVDVLRRFGIDVTLAGIKGKEAHECSRQVKIVPDLSIEEAISNHRYDVVVVPGGLKGCEEFGKNLNVGRILKEQDALGKSIAAICAGPTALKTHKICVGKKITCYPSLKDIMTEGNMYTYVENNVVIDGNLTTSRGPGTAFEFALAIAEQLTDRAKSDNIAKELLLK